MSKNDNELELLRNKIAELEAKNKQLSEQNSTEEVSSKYIKEMEAIRARGNASQSNITYKDIQGYKAVYLYHINGYNIGKRIGPLHPSNAEYAFNEFARLGIKLSINKPTDEEITKYKLSSEYLAYEKEFLKKQKADMRSIKADSIEKLTEQISKLAGTVVVNRIKEQHEVTGQR